MLIPRRLLALPLLPALLLAAACGASGGPGADATPPPAVERFASPNPGSVNTYWIDTPDGLVLVDALRTVPDARAALERIRAGGRSVAAILITHAHPDHVGGLGVFHEAFPDAPMYAAETTIATMATDAMGFYALTRENGDAFPAEVTVPDHPIGPDDTVTTGGLTLTATHFGPGETDSATAYYDAATGALFAGDLVSNAMTPALLEGHTCGWLSDLDALAAAYPDAVTIYPGHGEPGDAAALIAAQRDYLVFVRETVHAAVTGESPGGVKVTDAEKDAAVTAIENAYPGYELVASVAAMPEMNVDAVARELTTADPDTEPEVCRVGG